MQIICRVPFRPAAQSKVTKPRADYTTSQRDAHHGEPQQAESRGASALRLPCLFSRIPIVDLFATVSVDAV